MKSLTVLATLALAPLLSAEERLGDAWSDARNPIVRVFGGERLDLWSLKPVTPPELPGIEAAHPVDRLVLASGKEISAEADRRVLARRLSFDLTGLPPTPEEVAAFLADPGPDAYTRLVEGLLASPRYGEHWTRQWLDVVRYSDSNGFDWDEFRPLAWKFRDYVIRSLNADKPIDRFIVEQLAGDELLAGPPANESERDCLIATGFLRLGPFDNSNSLFNEQDRGRAELMNDLVETTGSAFLGLTFNCCRCHDHKFDPISHADYYRTRAVFESVKFDDERPIDLSETQERLRAEHGRIDAELKPFYDELLPLKEIEKLDRRQKARREALEKLCAELEATKPKFETALLATDAEEEPPATHVLYQGDYRDAREPVEPGLLSILDPNPLPSAAPANPKSKGRRLALARWITAPENPLTARVFVNRVWQEYFGTGLVATPNDFGFAGARPSDPALLDWLASEFLAKGWSLKHLHRLIVTSATYRQAAREPKRLNAEQLRDALLFVSGSLTVRDGGPPVWPELPADILQANPAFLDDNETKTKGWYPSPPEEQNARSLFLVRKRTVRIPFLETFDLPENMVSCGRRDVSTVAPQAFTLLNGPLAVAAAQAFAERIAPETDGARIGRAFQLAFQRPPEPAESAACDAFIRKYSLVEFCRSLLNTNEFLYLD